MTTSMRNLIAAIPWPNPVTIPALGTAIGSMHGLSVVVNPIPDELRHPEISGLVLTVRRRAHVYFDDHVSPINQLQTVLHEFAHILHGDIVPDEDSVQARRTAFDDPTEQRAERTGTILMRELHERRTRSTILDFFAGIEPASVINTETTACSPY